MRINGTSPAFGGIEEAKKIVILLKEQSASRFHAGARNGSIVQAIGEKFKKADLDFDFVQKAKKEKIDNEVFDGNRRLIKKAFGFLSEQLVDKS